VKRPGPGGRRDHLDSNRRRHHPSRHRLHPAYHGRAQSAIASRCAYDPVAGIPEFKVAAVRIEKLRALEAV
jgi:hypothetical protein